MQFKFKAVAISDGGNRPFVIHHRNLGGELQICGSYVGWAIHHQAADFCVLAAAVEDQLFAIQENVEYVFSNTRYRGVFVVYATNTHGSNCSAFQAAHQFPAQGIAKSCGLAAIEGPDHEYPSLGTVFADLVIDTVNLELQHGRKI
jgi:hypothetical protein